MRRMFLTKNEFGYSDFRRIVRMNVGTKISEEL